MAGVMMGLGAILDIVGKVKGSQEADRVQEILRNLPTYKKVDVGAEQQTTVNDNLSVLPSATKLTGQANAANVANAQAMYRSIIPDYDRLVAQASGLISDQLAGKLFGDEVSRSLSESAAKAVGGGFAGSGMWRNLTARDLGRTTYQVTQQGLTNAMNWLQTQRTMMPQPLSVQSMFLSPAERVQWGIQQNQLEYESLLRQKLGQASPGVDAFWSNALQKTGGQLMGMGGMMGGSGGGMLGGFGGGGGGGGGPGISGGTNIVGGSNFMDTYSLGSQGYDPYSGIPMDKPSW